MLSELDLQVHEFMLLYQEEHKKEPFPPTFQEIVEHFDQLTRRNQVLVIVGRLASEGLVEQLDRGSRKHVALSDERSPTES